MNRLQLATLLSWAGDNGLQGRKRLQKVVYFLQEAGCALDCRYTLHHFGPYSRDVADACDEMVAAGLVAETGGPANGEMQYTYTLKPATVQLLQQARDAHMQQFQPLGAELINQDLWQLELSSTILFFFRQTRNWDEALKGACAFKKYPAEQVVSLAALDFARRFEARPAN
ncbi:MAG: hypothetical protein IPK83_10785 [Planctomycetes bacterium]|nr:hypothetical protein [Planctomycetota bacterium]